MAISFVLKSRKVENYLSSEPTQHIHFCVTEGQGSQIRHICVTSFMDALLKVFIYLFIKLRGHSNLEIFFPAPSVTLNCLFYLGLHTYWHNSVNLFPLLAWRHFWAASQGDNIILRLNAILNCVLFIWILLSIYRITNRTHLNPRGQYYQSSFHCNHAQKNSDVRIKFCVIMLIF